MNVVAIVQARMGSTRLPGKVMADIGGRTMLGRVLERLARCRRVPRALVATTTRAEDEAVAQEARAWGAEVFQGSEEDVLDRYVQAARSVAADPVVRVTADCPLLDSEVVDRTVAAFLRERPDYASNTMERTYPRGLDTEVIATSALQRASEAASEAYQRVHVTPYIYEHPEKFRLLSVRGPRDLSEERWTVDTEEDLELVRAVYARLGGAHFGWEEVMGLLRREPDLRNLNRSVRHKELREG